MLDWTALSRNAWLEGLSIGSCSLMHTTLLNRQRGRNTQRLHKLPACFIRVIYIYTTASSWELLQGSTLPTSFLELLPNATRCQGYIRHVLGLTHRSLMQWYNNMTSPTATSPRPPAYNVNWLSAFTACLWRWDSLKKAVSSLNVIPIYVLRTRI